MTGPTVCFGGDALDGREDLLDPGAVKDPFVEVMARAVIPQVEAEDVIPAAEKAPARREHVRGSGTALPAVKQDDEAAAAADRLDRAVTQEPHPAACIDENGLGAFAKGVFPPRAEPEAGQNRLQVRVPQGPDRLEGPVKGRVHRGRRHHRRVTGSPAGTRRRGFSSRAGPGTLLNSSSGIAKKKTLSNIFFTCAIIPGHDEPKRAGQPGNGESGMGLRGAGVPPVL